MNDSFARYTKKQVELMLKQAKARRHAYLKSAKEEWAINEQARLAKKWYFKLFPAKLPSLEQLAKEFDDNINNWEHDAEWICNKGAYVERVIARVEKLLNSSEIYLSSDDVKYLT